jgi:DNA-binding NarL/FixJ family response regulator
MSPATTNLSEYFEASVPARHDGTQQEQPRALEVLLVDDDRAAGYRLWALLNWRPEIRICATAESAAEAIKAIRGLRPDACLIAAALGEQEGLRLCHAIKQLPNPPWVLIYGDYPSGELDGAALIAGADGAVSRYGDADAFERTIKCIVAGNLVQQAPVGADRVHDLIDRVQARDRAIATMLMERVPPDDIAHTLGISASSLRVRRREIVRRLEQSLRSQSASSSQRPPGVARHLKRPALGERGVDGAVESRRARLPIIQKRGVTPRGRFTAGSTS